MSRSRQLEINFARGTWGGRRSGSGRPEGPNPRVQHRPRKDLDERTPYHVTLRVRREVGSIRTFRVVREIEASFRKACERGKFRLVHYSIQRDHAHLIVEAENADVLGRGMMSIASRLARAVNRALGRTGRVLADRYHLQVLTCPTQVRNALAYVLLNARRHAAKRRARLASTGALDAASSARWFEGWRRDVPVDRSPPRALGSTPAVAKPRTWFLRAGWRVHGLLDPNAIPGGMAS